MGFIAKDSGGGDFEQPPIGTHVARCIKIIDIGTQKGEYQGKATFRRQVIIGWELPIELMTTGEYAGKPFIVSKFYTASLSEKSNLRADLKNWRGRDFTDQEPAGFDAKNIIGKSCMLSITLNDKSKARVTGVMALPKGTAVPDQVNQTVYLSLEPGEFDQNTFDNLSDGYKKIIVLSPEYQSLQNHKNSSYNEGSGFKDFEDDIPFS